MAAARRYSSPWRRMILTGILTNGTMNSDFPNRNEGCTVPRKKAKNERPCALYARYSSAQQNSRSCDDQLATSREYAIAQGWRVVAEYRDDAISGAKGREDRPGWDALLSWLEAGNLTGGVVLTWDWDRWSRDPYDGPIARLQIQRLGIDVADTAAGIFGRDVGGQVLATDKEQGAADFLAKLRRNTRRGQAAKRAEGYWHGPAPFGFDLSSIEGGTSLSKNDDEARWVKRMYQLHEKGLGFSGIAKLINSEGARTKRVKPWRSSYVRQTMTSAAVAGFVGPGMKRLDTTRLVPGKHKGIIEEKRWRHVVDVARAAQAGSLQHARRAHPLSGLVKCGLCGAPAWLRGATGYRGYQCREHYNGCAASKPVKLAWLEDSVMAWWRSLLDDKALRKVAKEQVALEHKRAVKAQKRQGEISDCFDELDRQEQALIDLQLAGGETDLVAKRIAQIQDNREALATEFRSHDLKPLPIEKTVHKLRQMLEAVDTPERLREYIDSILIHDDHVEFNAFGLSVNMDFHSG